MFHVIIANPGWASETGGHAVDNSPGGDGPETSPWSRSCLTPYLLETMFILLPECSGCELGVAVMWFDVGSCFVAPDLSGWTAQCKVSSKHEIYMDDVSVCACFLVFHIE
jgi:hypothetical protein